MKVFACLSLIAAVFFLQNAEAASLESTEVNIGTAIKMFLKNVHRIMPCGFEQLNISALAPVHVEHYEFKSSDKYHNISGHVSNFWINGLADAKMLGGTYDTKNNILRVDFILPQIQLLAEYEIENFAQLGGFPLRFDGKGLLNNKFVDLRLVGEFVLSQALENPKGLRISDFDLKFFLGDAIISNVNYLWDNALNNFVNKMSGEAILAWAQQVQNRVDGYFAKYVLDKINARLQNISKEELLNKIIYANMILEMVNCPPSPAFFN